MTDIIQRDLLLQSVAEWNRWREQRPTAEIDLSFADLSSVNLSGADLSGAHLSFADLSFADLRGAHLRGTDLRGADLRNVHLNGADLNGADLRDAKLMLAHLIGAHLSFADLSGANLMFADLSNVHLRGANLSSTNLTDANLSSTNLTDANLSSTNLNGADLRDADLHNATIGSTSFGDHDFREIKGLDTINHDGPSPLSINSIYLSRGDIPEAFMRGTGAPDTFLEYMHALTSHPIEYYTCFISYSSKDQNFAERLYADLQQNGVRCWFAPHEMRPGTVIVRGIDEAIRLYDKLLLVLSQHSVESTWVEFEVAAALEKEKDQQKDTLFPIRLDDTILTTKQAWAAGIRRQRHIGDFTQWKNHDTYQLTFERLLRDLKQGKA